MEIRWVSVEQNATVQEADNSADSWFENPMLWVDNLEASSLHLWKF